MSEKKKEKDFNDSELFAFDKTSDLSVRYLRESYNAAKSRASELSTSGGLSVALRGHSQQAVRIYSALATLLYATISISKADDLERFVKKRAFQVPNNLFDIEEWGPVLKIARTVRIGEMARYQDELSSFKSHINANISHVCRMVKAVATAWKAEKAETTNALFVLRAELQALRSSIMPLMRSKIMELEQHIVSLKRDHEYKDQTIARVMESEQIAKKNHLSELNIFERRYNQDLQSMRNKYETDMSTMDQKHQQVLEDMRSDHKRALEASEARRVDMERSLRAQLEDLKKTTDAAHDQMVGEHNVTVSQLETNMSRMEKQYKDTITQNHASLELAAARNRILEDRMKTAEMEIDHLKKSLESVTLENKGHKARCVDYHDEVVALQGELAETKRLLDLKTKELRDRELASEEEICKKEGEFGSLLSKLFEAERVASDTKKAAEKKVKALEGSIATLRNSMREMEREKENELCAKESSFGSLLSKLFEAERLMGVMRKEHEAEKRSLERKLSNAVRVESTSAQYVGGCLFAFIRNTRVTNIFYIQVAG